MGETVGVGGGGGPRTHSAQTCTDGVGVALCFRDYRLLKYLELTKQTCRYFGGAGRA